MKLTGKCKEDFEKWRMKQNYDVDAPFFYDLKYSMQYGVYVDFFDSLDVFIYIIAWETEVGDFYFKYEIIGFWGNHSASLRCETRQEARDAAIEKANELYNL
jgi:NADH:ubiquinone oxidoreductase subunit 4 (subunit M)